jgi:formiminoglutamase
MTDWLEVHRGDVPLVIAMPHSGSDVPPELADRFVSPWLARKDTDWWIDQVYAFARELGATTVRTRISRSVIDCNRDPSGASLYPGMTTTELCPTSTFEGEALYRGDPPDTDEIARRTAIWFAPYHAAVAGELQRLKARHGRVVLYDAHSIRSRVSRLFEGELPQFNIGSNSGRACDPALAARISEICAASGRTHVLDGRFKGGWTTRHHGRPAEDVHAIQMELAFRGYHREPEVMTPDTWPGPYDPSYAAPIVSSLTDIVKACIAFART